MLDGAGNMRHGKPKYVERMGVYLCPSCGCILEDCTCGCGKLICVNPKCVWYVEPH